MTLLRDFLDTWASIYANHATLRAAIAFFHVGGLVIGGGSAIAADRLTLRLFRRPADRRTQWGVLHGTHRVVLGGLAAVVVSGILLFAADVESFLYSGVFWLKIGLFVALLINGAALVHAGNQVERGNDGSWNRLATSSALSVVLWLTTTLVGAALPNFI
ncbi:MAG TPA: hypothetical protein VFY29_14180 [Terriglobia bacterium]|nr:hypothetical protein [Terriglobia bacterium]